MKLLALVAFVAVLGMAAAAPARSLQEDLHEFVELIPIDKIREIAKRYIKDDAEVQQALAYLQGEEWQELVSTVRKHPTWIRFKTYMNEAGIDIDAIIQAIHDFIANAGNKTAAKAQGTRTMREFIDEILALVPLPDLLALLNDKLTNSTDFQEFWTKISGDDAYKMVEEIRALPEVQRVAEVLRKMGLDIDKVLDLVYGLFGWEV